MRLQVRVHSQVRVSPNAIVGTQLRFFVSSSIEIDEDRVIGPGAVVPHEVQSPRRRLETVRGRCKLANFNLLVRWSLLLTML